MRIKKYRKNNIDDYFMVGILIICLGSTQLLQHLSNDRSNKFLKAEKII